MKRLSRCLPALVLGVLLSALAPAGLAHAQVASTNPGATAPTASPQPANAAPPADYRLGAGDTLRVQVFQNPDLTVEARVSESGSIGYPLLGQVQVGGLTLREAQQRVADGLRQGRFLRAPQVTLQLLQARGHQVAVLGQVARPGRFALEASNVRASDILAAAGGITPQGDDVVIISGRRNGQPFRRVVDVQALFAGTATDQDLLLDGGDTLFVPRAPVFYIYGEAQRPGPYRIERGMTMMQALAAGGGPTPRGSATRLRLHRAGADGQVVQSSPEMTERVQPNDVIYVRESLF